MSRTMDVVHVEVPEPPCPDGQVITGYLVQVSSGSHPNHWRFDDLSEAVERWADEGMDRCYLAAFAVAPDDGTEYPREYRTTFSRGRGWDKWEEI